MLTAPGAVMVTPPLTLDGAGASPTVPYAVPIAPPERWDEKWRVHVFLKAASALPGHPTRPALSIAKHISRLLGGVWLAAGLAPGCSGERPEPAIVRDSAGVRIVEIAAPVWDEGSGWTLAAEPSLRLGAAEGNAAHRSSAGSAACSG